MFCPRHKCGSPPPSQQQHGHHKLQQPRICRQHGTTVVGAAPRSRKMRWQPFPRPARTSILLEQGQILRQRRFVRYLASKMPLCSVPLWGSARTTSLASQPGGLSLSQRWTQRRWPNQANREQDPARSPLFAFPLRGRPTDAVSGASVNRTCSWQTLPETGKPKSVAHRE